MKSRFPFYHDNETREMFFLELGSDKFVNRGETFKHLMALKISVWYDMDEIMQDVGQLFYREMALAGVLAEEWEPLITPRVLARCYPLRQEVQKALSVGIAKTDAALTGQPMKKVSYSAPTGVKLNVIYRAVLLDALTILQADHHGNASGLRAMARDLED